MEQSLPPSRLEFIKKNYTETNELVEGEIYGYYDTSLNVFHEKVEVVKIITDSLVQISITIDVPYSSKYVQNSIIDITKSQLLKKLDIPKTSRQRFKQHFRRYKGKTQ